MKHLTAKETKDSGAHYTPNTLAVFVARKIEESLDWKAYLNESINVLDPAVGDGELLLSIARRLVDRKNNRSKLVFTGFDTDSVAIENAKTRFLHSRMKGEFLWKVQDFLEMSVPDQDLFYISDKQKHSYDIVIANPPYVRTQHIGADKARNLRSKFGLSGRVDLYHAFVLAIAEVLSPGGTAGIILSNKFLTTLTSATLRSAIIERFDVLHIWDLGDTRLFNAAVLPAVMLLKKKNGSVDHPRTKFTSIYTTNKCTEDAKDLATVFDALCSDGIIRLPQGVFYEVKQGELDFGDHPGNVWRIGNNNVDNWLNKVKQHTSSTFADIGNVKVGVKSTADKVFIRKDWDSLPKDQHPELLRKLITHHHSRRYKGLEWKTYPVKILYPHTVLNGKRTVVDIERYPRSYCYLETMRNTLEKRTYVTGAGRKWYEVWVPHDPESWGKPKLIFRDICEQPTFWMDTEDHIVNGDCYWIVTKPDVSGDNLWLALAVGNSSFIEAFYDHSFQNMLYAGRRRFMTQYVERFPLPNPSLDISKKIIRKAKQLYDKIGSSSSESLERELNILVWKAFGFSQEEIGG